MESSKYIKTKKYDFVKFNNRRIVMQDTGKDFLVKFKSSSKNPTDDPNNTSSIFRIGIYIHTTSINISYEQMSYLTLLYFNIRNYE